MRLPHPTTLLVIGRMSLSVQHSVGSAGNCYGQGLRGVPLDMSRIHPECPVQTLLIDR